MKLTAAELSRALQKGLGRRIVFSVPPFAIAATFISGVFGAVYAARLGTTDGERAALWERLRVRPPPRPSRGNTRFSAVPRYVPVCDKPQRDRALVQAIASFLATRVGDGEDVLEATGECFQHTAPHLQQAVESWMTATAELNELLFAISQPGKLGNAWLWACLPVHRSIEAKKQRVHRIGFELYLRLLIGAHDPSVCSINAAFLNANLEWTWTELLRAIVWRTTFGPQESDSVDAQVHAIDRLMRAWFVLVPDSRSRSFVDWSKKFAEEVAEARACAEDGRLGTDARQARAVVSVIKGKTSPDPSQPSGRVAAALRWYLEQAAPQLAQRHAPSLDLYPALLKVLQSIPGAETVKKSNDSLPWRGPDFAWTPAHVFDQLCHAIVAGTPQDILTPDLFEPPRGRGALLAALAASCAGWAQASCRPATKPGELQSYLASEPSSPVMEEWWQRWGAWLEHQQQEATKGHPDAAQIVRRGATGVGLRRTIEREQQLRSTPIVQCPAPTTNEQVEGFLRFDQLLQHWTPPTEANPRQSELVEGIHRALQAPPAERAKLVADLLLRHDWRAKHQDATTHLETAIEDYF